MSKEMKYEAVFCFFYLFDGVSCAAIIVIKSNGTGRYTITENECSDIIKLNVCQPDIEIAMRRIIQEPKRWTVEDQKAGRLPEVGAELLHESEGCVNFVGEFDFRWMLRTKEGGLYLAEKFYCSPIETPEEKSARLREEWCIKALSSCSISSGMQKYELTRLGGYIEDIYDALLSGELQAPKGE